MRVLTLNRPYSRTLRQSHASFRYQQRPVRNVRSLKLYAATPGSLLNNKAFFIGFLEAGLPPELKSALDNIVASNKIVVFMKGNKQFPQCGYSNTVVQVSLLQSLRLSLNKVHKILNTLEVPFETVDILETEALRQAMKIYSQWPTFPQVYIDGEFFGGCDIMIGTFLPSFLNEAFLQMLFNPEIFKKLLKRHRILELTITQFKKTNPERQFHNMKRTISLLALVEAIP